MRGNLIRSGQEYPPKGSIPAHAGEPGPCPIDARIPRVYPRACGGTPSVPWVRSDRTGLSPRMRGNQGHGPAGDDRGGSIPAHAGEPLAADRTSRTSPVYPRACGGTVTSRVAKVPVGGLSPRMRGNQVDVDPIGETRGSIPAHAGEPSLGSSLPLLRRVYPRACGGTASRIRGFCHLPGLSPRMRGNRRRVVVGHCCRGSIPAHAGEPIDGVG